MKRILPYLLICLCLGFHVSPGTAGTVTSVNCVVYQTSGPCTSAVTHIEFTALTTSVVVNGYNNPSDGGGGAYAMVGAASAACPTVTNTGVALTSGSNQFSVASIGSPSVLTGSLITDSTTPANIPAGAEVAKITGTGPYTITMTALATAAATSDSITIAGNNGGTLLQDAAGNCLQKVNYRGDPHEWGAFGDGNTDDHAALQSWLGSIGPWEATIPAIYDTLNPLTCWPNSNLRAPANDSRESQIAPIVEIKADPNFTGGSGSPVLTAQNMCRISGLSIDANVANATGNNNFVDALDIVGGGVVIDGHAILQRGYYNVYCNGTTLATAGAQLKDSQFNKSWSDNLHFDSCGNVRLTGDVIALGGASGSSGSQDGVYFRGDDLTLSGGVIEQTSGIGLQLYDATDVSATGMFFDSSGQSASGAGVEIDSSNHVSICGNHFKANDETATGSTAHIRFGTDGTSLSNDITLCGNAYATDTNSGHPPKYVYDSQSSTGPLITGGNIYESAPAQNTGVFSPAAASAVLPFLQYAPGFPNNSITGLTLSNDASSTTAVDFAAGQAADSTNSAIITLPPNGTAACKVDLANPDGPNGLDTGSAHSNRTYFYFVIAQPGGAKGASSNAPSCMASASLTPSFAHASGYALYRLVGALYTKATTTDIIPFVQNDDTFTLSTSASFSLSSSLGTGSTAVTLGSVPSQIGVQAFGRCAASTAVFLSAGNVSAQTPSSTFSTTPGYMVNSPTPNTSFPFSLYTTGASGMPPGGTINAAAASGTTNSLTCYNDGWVWHRGR